MKVESDIEIVREALLTSMDTDRHRDALGAIDCIEASLRSAGAQVKDTEAAFEDVLDHLCAERDRYEEALRGIRALLNGVLGAVPPGQLDVLPDDDQAPGSGLFLGSTPVVQHAPLADRLAGSVNQIRSHR